MATLLFIIAIILFILLIVVHELGHAIVARRNGVVVEEFGIFFPPRMWKKKLKNGVLFTVNAIPLGGFVKMQGESDDADAKGDYGAAGLWAKTKILLAGVGMNFLIAILLFTILAWTGLPKVVPRQFTVPADTEVVAQKVLVANVVKGSPAADTKLSLGDAIKKVDGRVINSSRELSKVTQKNAGEKVTITYAASDSGTIQQTTVKLRGKKAKAQLGVAPVQRTIRQSTWSAPIVGVGLTAQLTWKTLKAVGAALGNLVLGLVQQLSFSEQTQQAASKNLRQAGSKVGGPVLIVAVLLQIAEQMGLTGVLLIIALISLSLALLNALPIPALDGGRLAVTLIFHGLKKPLAKPLEEKIQTTGFMVLIALVIVITINDIQRVF